MAVLSVLHKDGIFVGCASPVFLTSELDIRKGANLTLEILEADASSLKRMIGKVETFGLGNDQPPFVAEVTSIAPCTSTASGLALLRDRPTMRCVLTIHGPMNLQQPH